MNYFWVDMEMSGLDPESCRILEVAAIITNGKFESLATYQAIVYQTPEVLGKMDAWCTQTHGKSGLTAAVATGKPESQVEQEILTLLSIHFGEQDRPILCGNSIFQDRKFIDKYWPALSRKLHYRMLDVSSFKIVFKDLFKIEFEKKGGHRALDDIEESIAELKAYLAHVKQPQ